jgi:hypothetical protein
MMGALPPTPRDLTLFLPEWMLPALLQNSTCRTIEMLDRRIGVRRDKPA